MLFRRLSVPHSSSCARLQPALADCTIRKLLLNFAEFSPVSYGSFATIHEKPRSDRDSGFLSDDSVEPSSLFVALGEEIPLERGHQRGVPP